MKKCFAYIRVSTTRQGQTGVSLQQQREVIEGYASRHNLYIERWFEEQETAAKSGRPIFGHIINLLRRQKGTGIIIHKIDRSARNWTDWAELNTLIDSGVEVHFANEALDLQSRGGRLSADVQAVMAVDYSRNLREETKKGFYGRLKQGLFPMPAPVGYLNAGGGKPKEVDPKTAPLITRAFELYATGKFNLRTLTNEMHRLGLRSRSGKRIGKNGFSMILRNSFYIGIIRIKKTADVFQGVHKPIISKITFERVQAALNGRGPRATASHDFLYRRMVHCSRCAKSLYGEQQRGHTYYRCHNPQCPVTCIREETFDAVVSERLKAIQFTKDESAYMKGMIETLAENSIKNRQQYLSGLRLQLAQAEDRLNRLTDAFVDQLIDKTAFVERKAALLIARTGIKDHLAQAENGGDPATDFIRRILERAEAVYTTYKMGSHDVRRQILQDVISNRTTDGKTIEFTYYSPYQEIADRQKLQDGGPRRAEPRTLKRLLSKLMAFVERETRSKECPVAA
jgi:DNA invertase Pin-like site-specific DNA recombinase